ncbi:MAG: hypothetical protein K2Q12_08790 [Rickettsiales bacterium]|nr:hypothetical protein [Rickettsiales bacterium]
MSQTPTLSTERWGRLTSLYEELTQSMGAMKMQAEPPILNYAANGHTQDVNIAQASAKFADYKTLITLLNASLDLGWSREKQALAAMIRVPLHNTVRFVGVEEIPTGLGGNSGTHPLFGIAQYARVLGRAGLAEDKIQQELRAAAVPILVHDDGELIEYGTVNDNALGTGKDVDTLEKACAALLYRLAASYASQNDITGFFKAVLPIQQHLMEVQHLSRRKGRLQELSAPAKALFDEAYVAQRAQNANTTTPQLTIEKSDLPHVFERAIAQLQQLAENQPAPSGAWATAADEFTQANVQAISDTGLMKQKVYQIETIEGTRHMLRFYTQQLTQSETPFRAELTPSFFISNQHKRNLGKASELFAKAMQEEGPERESQLAIARALFVEQMRVTQRYTAYRGGVWDRAATKDTEKMGNAVERAEIVGSQLKSHRDHRKEINQPAKLLPVETTLRQIAMLQAAIDAVQLGTWVPTEKQCLFFGQLGAMAQSPEPLEFPGVIQELLARDGGRFYQKKAMHRLHDVYEGDLGDAASRLLPAGTMTLLKHGRLHPSPTSDMARAG